MAVTGASTGVIPRPAQRKVGGLVRNFPEGSSQTFAIGAIISRGAGAFAVLGSSAELQSTGILGFAISKGSNRTTNGLNSTPIFVPEKGLAFRIAFQATWTGSAHRGLTAALYMDASQNVWVSSGGASTCGTIIDAAQWDTGVAVADGDVNPVVYFVLADTAVQYA